MATNGTGSAPALDNVTLGAAVPEPLGIAAALTLFCMGLLTVRVRRR
jgi:hypothetical protein